MANDPYAMPLISGADFTGFGSNAELVQNTAIWTTAAIASLIARATRGIESKCDRRLAAFSDLTETSRATGIDMDGMGGADVPVDMQASLGMSQARAYGNTRLVRDFWLDQFAPRYPDLWSYNLTNLTIVIPYGGSQSVPLQGLEGPEPDSGHLRLQLGTLCPPGSTVRFTYSGGYTIPPEDLQLACIFQATKYLLLGAEPEMRAGMNTADLDTEIASLLVPYLRF
jgi:hypothetical protein